MNHLALIATLTACVLAGCAGDRGLFATVGPDYTPATPRTAGKWQASLDGSVELPHAGRIDALTRWWDGFDDPLLSDLLRSAQAVSADLASAQSRIAQSRASAVAAGARGLPMFDIEAAISRSSFTFGGPATLRTQQQIGLQTSWEIDLFGGLAREREAARAQFMARTASWHDARVSVAAETADAYLSVRDCERRQQVADADQASRRASLDATERLVDAGFQPPSERALARASLAEAASQAAAVRADCSRAIKRLVELSGMDEAVLRERLAEGAARLPRPPALPLDSVPARALRQRPDVSAAERELAEASARIGVAEAARYPALSVTGNITPTRVAINGGSAVSTQTWSIGPTLTLPLFDAGRRAADVEAARAEYTARASAFDAAVRRAVREVEEALVRLDAVAQRVPEAMRALDGYGERLTAVESQRAAGLASLNDEEIARRAELSARSQLIELERERVAALIALYRASGGDWTGPQDIPKTSDAGDSR
ncbi:efflux transporter outer membrane subunit [Methyloversatilis thermotolerans]|uniref:efflux transporter outer membrane subunit n=1 Tax=Methyloversatilis thermotolerans TaxID=1346290 RepID=UPI0003A6351A|nr:efflux transporter outer membrane subunit [Methyloversatilis thermotolerans]